MKTVFLLLIFSLCCVCCTSKSPTTEKAQQTKETSVLSIKNQKLYPVLDSVINFAKRCFYYQDSLHFYLSIQFNEFIFDSQSGVSIDKALFRDVYGCFKYKEHFFFVSKTNDNSLFGDWFLYSNRKITFPCGNNEAMIDDDNWVHIVFYLENGIFKLKDRSLCE